MIISDKYNFCFVHIPKCAGTSVRGVLQKFDETLGRFTGHVGAHPEIGKLDYVHIPLAILREYFPGEYKKIKNYHSVAVVRDPYERFPSSLTQHLRMYGEKPIQKMSTKEIRSETDRCINFLDKNRDITLLPPDYIHFQRQCTYIFDNEECLVDKLYTTNQVDQLLCDLSEKTGFPLAKINQDKQVHANRSVVVRTEGLRILYQATHPLFSKPLNAVLTDNIKQKIRNFIYVPRDKRLRDILSA